VKSDTTRPYMAHQIAQHAELGLDLQRANAHARHLLLRFARLSPHQRRFMALRAELASVAELMTLQISCCDAIAENKLSQQIEHIRVRLRTTCDFCEENPALSSSEKHDARFGRLTPSPAWTTQLDSLTGLTTRIFHDIFGNSFSAGGETKKSVHCFNKLHTAIRRQRRHLKRIAARKEPKITVEHDISDVCDRCGRRYE
jgi:hypothetical protein